jgi:hypothetical protein
MTREDFVRSALSVGEVEALKARIVELKAALRMCMLEHHKSAAQFRFYEVSHLSKTPPDTEKAKTNADHQIRCLAARDAAAKMLK